MAARARKPKVLAVLCVLVAISVVTIGAITMTGSAAARAETQVRPLNETGLTARKQQGVERIAEKSGVPASEVREVAAKGNGYARSGLYVGKDARGNEEVSFFSPRVFTGFVDVRKITSDREIFVSSGIEPGVDGQTGHVQIGGVAAPTVKKIEITLVDGSRLATQLVSLVSGGYSYFTYVSDDPGTFPQVVKAFDANGGRLAAWDVSRDIQPPNAR